MFTWTCDVCGRRVVDGDGYIEADMTAAMRALEEEEVRRQRRRARGNQPVRLSEVALVELVPWHAVHAECDPFPDGPSYLIEIERIRTLPDLLEWCRHLSEKRWLPMTDWFRFLKDRLG